MSGLTIPIILRFDGRILMGAAVTILSLLETAPDSTAYALHVLHPGLKDDSIDAFRQMVEGTRHAIHFHLIPPSRVGNVPTNRGSWTEVIYYRLLIPDLFPNFDKVIYSDVDVCVRRDLAEVFSADLTDYQWG